MFHVILIPDINLSRFSRNDAQTNCQQVIFLSNTCRLSNEYFLAVTNRLLLVSDLRKNKPCLKTSRQRSHLSNGRLKKFWPIHYFILFSTFWSWALVCQSLMWSQISFLPGSFTSHQQVQACKLLFVFVYQN